MLIIIKKILNRLYLDSLKKFTSRLNANVRKIGLKESSFGR